jgi:hypothetical protein
MDYPPPDSIFTIFQFTRVTDVFFRIDTKAFRVRVWRGYSVSRMLHTKCPVLRAASLIYSDSFSGSVVVLFICTAEIAHCAIKKVALLLVNNNRKTFHLYY